MKVEKIAKNIASSMTPLGTAMKMFLCESHQRKSVFDEYYDRLKELVKSNIIIEPDDALALLIHHIFMKEFLSELLCDGRPLPPSPLINLLDDTSTKLKCTGITHEGHPWYGPVDDPSVIEKENKGIEKET